MVSGGWLPLSELPWIPACPARGSFLALEPPPALIGTFPQAHLLAMSLTVKKYYLHATKFLKKQINCLNFFFVHWQDYLVFYRRWQRQFWRFLVLVKGADTQGECWQLTWPASDMPKIGIFNHLLLPSWWGCYAPLGCFPGLVEKTVKQRKRCHALLGMLHSTDWEDSETNNKTMTQALKIMEAHDNQAQWNDWFRRGACLLIRITGNKIMSSQLVRCCYTRKLFLQLAM